MSLSECKRKRLIEKFEMMFPEMAEKAVKYGEFRGDNETLSVIMNGNVILAFSYNFSSVMPDWKLQSYKSYHSHLASSAVHKTKR